MCFSFHPQESHRTFFDAIPYAAEIIVKETTQRLIGETEQNLLQQPDIITFDLSFFSCLNKDSYTKIPLVRIYIFFFFNMYYNHKHSNYAVTHPLFIYMFHIYLCSIGSVRNASDADNSVIFRNSFFSVYRHSDLEGSCSNGTKTVHLNLAVACGP